MKVERPNAKEPTPEEVRELEKLKAAIERAVADGFTFLALGVDTVFLSAGARDALAHAREVRP